MKDSLLMCNTCGRREDNRSRLGVKCEDGCGGFYVANLTMGDETDPTGRDPHSPGAKLDGGKVLAGILGDFSLALLEVAKVGTYGAEKYTRHGWEEVPDGIQRYTDAKFRHLLNQGYDNDTGLLHLAHECWNNLAILELTLRDGGLGNADI